MPPRNKQRHANANATNGTSPLPPDPSPDVTQLVQTTPETLEEDVIEPQTVEDFRASLAPIFRNRGNVYAYRQRPKVKTKTGTKYIEKWPLNAFSIEDLVEEHGGGKYKLQVDIGDNLNHTFYHEQPGQARIHPDFVLVDENGRELTPEPAAAAAKNEIVSEVARVVSQAATAGNVSNQEAMRQSFDLISQGAKMAVQLATSTAKGDSSEVAALTAKVDALQNTILAEREDRLKQENRELRERVEQLERTPAGNGNAGGPGELTAMATVANMLDVDGGAVGLVQKLAGGKDESWLEFGGKQIFGAVADIVRQAGPGLVNAFQDWAYSRKVEVLQRQGATEIPPAPAPVAAVGQAHPLGPVPVAGPSNAPSQPVDTEEVNMKQTIEFLMRELPNTIRYYKDQGFDGDATAVVCKTNFMQWLPLIRSQFSDLAAVKKLAETHPVLQTITQHEDWEEWAQDFFTEFHVLTPFEQTGPQSVPAASGSAKVQ